MQKELDKQSNNNNLKRGNPAWVKGKSGNPNGRPKKNACLTSLMKELLDRDAEWIAPGATPDDKTWQQMIVKALLTKAAKGDIKAIELVLDRTEGKVTQPIGGENGQPIRTEIVVSTDATKKLLTEIMKGITPHALHHD
ncbi:MAG: hypothetical protein KAS32_21035 [Candidatus Peribacteraceae bacterium]|nr:hypothetical protein [Candidatus Peribacteraceae bacterium]